MIGWLLTALAIAIFAVAFYYQRKRKAADRLKPKPPEIRLPLFPMIHGPMGMPMSELKNWAQHLRHVYELAWREFSAIYGIRVPHPLAVSRIVLVSGTILQRDHKYVMWNAPRGSLKLLIIPEALYWFAGELHNVFRCSQFGPDHIYKPRNPTDLDAARRVQEWIEDSWGHNQKMGET